MTQGHREDRSRADRFAHVTTVAAQHDRATVRVTGEVDIATGPIVWSALRKHLAAGRRFLRLDLSEVTFLDASGLNGITAVHHAALEQRGTLVLTGVHERVAEMIRVTGLDEFLLIGGSRAEDDDRRDDSEQRVAWPARQVHAALPPTRAGSRSRRRV